MSSEYFYIFISAQDSEEMADAIRSFNAVQIDYKRLFLLVLLERASPPKPETMAM
jgi:hypothetical protein